MGENKCRRLFRKIYFLVGREFHLWNHCAISLSGEDETWFANNYVEWINWLQKNCYTTGHNHDEVFTNKFIEEVIENG